MFTFDPAAIAGIIANLLTTIASYAAIAALLYNIGGVLIRTVSWTFDKLLIRFIGSFFGYFETIIGGEILTDTVVDGMLNRVYLLVGVFVAFRLGMLLFQYIINPSEVMDEKVGVNALVKRIILGLILMIFLPKIFEYCFNLQKAILDDQVIERIIMEPDKIAEVNKHKKKHGMGKIIGMTIFRGFFNLSSKGQANNTARTNFEKATDIAQTYDLAVIDSLGFGLDSGILNEIGNEYTHDYFPIFSTVVLGFTLYLVIQYCLDAVVRSFKLSVLQVIAPIAIVEYMINSDRNEVFKSWRKAVVATFAMLFMRVASIWFVAYVTMLMQPGAISSKSLLQTDDNLLKAIIVLGLLAFMMDFPKMMSDVFGLDLEQSGSVKNVMGKTMGAATAGLAIGGAVAGAGMKAAGALSNTAKGTIGKLSAGRANKFNQIAGDLPDGSDAKNKALKKVKNANSFSKGLSNPVKSSLGQATAIAGNSVAALGAVTKSARDGTSVKDNYGVNKAAIQDKVDKVKDSKIVQGAANIGGAIKDSAKKNKLGTTLASGTKAIGSAILSSNKYTGAVQSGYQNATKNIDQDVDKLEQREKQAEEKAKTQAYRQHQMQVADAQLEEQQHLNIKWGVDKNIDSVDVIKKADALKDAGKLSSSDTVIGNLQNMNQTLDATRETTVKINDKVETLVETSNDIKQDVHTTASTVQHIDQTTDVISNNTANIKANTDVIKDNTINIQDNTEVIANSTMNIENNVDTLVETNKNISHKINQIEDNTFYPGIEAIETLDLNESNNNAAGTIGGVPVSKPDISTGERKTKGGLIVPGSSNLDNKK